MSRIFISGDVHGNLDIDKLKRLNSRYGKELTRSDYVIICGDSGICWDGGNIDRALQDIYIHFPWTTIVVPGNHENYNIIESLPIVTMLGAHMRRLSEYIYFVERGEIFYIDALSFFAFGGAQSHDKWLRRENESWWSREEPSMDEFQHGFATLDNNDNMVDFIITHEVSDYYLDVLSHRYANYQHYALSNYFEGIRETVTYKHWFAGHHHIDQVFDPTQSILYDEIVEIAQDGYLTQVKLYTE